MEHINNADQIEEVRIRTILDEKIEEKFPINYDAVQELAEKADALNSCTFVPYCGWYKGEKSTYVEYLTLRDVLQQFYIGFLSKLNFEFIFEDLIAKFLAYRELFNLITDM